MGYEEVGICMYVGGGGKVMTCITMIIHVKGVFGHFLLILLLDNTLDCDLISIEISFF